MLSNMAGLWSSTLWECCYRFSQWTKRTCACTRPHTRPHTHPLFVSYQTPHLLWLAFWFLLSWGGEYTKLAAHLVRMACSGQWRRLSQLVLHSCSCSICRQLNSSGFMWQCGNASSQISLFRFFQQYMYNQISCLNRWPFESRFTKVSHEKMSRCSGLGVHSCPS